MVNSQIGYIICESDYETSNTQVTAKRVNGKLVAEAVLQEADEKNRNGRYYSEEELFGQLRAPRTLELLNAGYLRAECGHPLSKDLQRQSTIDDTKTCARFLKLWTEGKKVKAHVIGTNNEYGKAFNSDLEEGCLPAWSLRALGSVENTRRGAEVKNLRLITWDQVIYPSHPGAYTQGLVTESGIILPDSNLQRIVNESYEENEEIDNRNNISKSGIMIPITNESVLRFLQQESSNLKFVRECFDFAYSGITVNESGTKVVLTTVDGDTMVINMESYVHNQLMNYASDFNVNIPVSESIDCPFSSSSFVVPDNTEKVVDESVENISELLEDVEETPVSESSEYLDIVSESTIQAIKEFKVEKNKANLAKIALGALVGGVGILAAIATRKLNKKNNDVIKAMRMYLNENRDCIAYSTLKKYIATFNEETMKSEMYQKFKKIVNKDDQEWAIVIFDPSDTLQIVYYFDQGTAQAPSGALHIVTTTTMSTKHYRYYLTCILIANGLWSERAQQWVDYVISHNGAVLNQESTDVVFGELLEDVE